MSGSTTALKNKWTARGIKDKAWDSMTDVESGALMSISVELDATTSTPASEACFLLGLEIDYVPRLTTGHAGLEYDAPLVGAPPV